MSLSLTEALAPLTPEEFFGESWGKSFRVVRGRPGKFAGLLPWVELNRLLARSVLDYPRLRVVKEAKAMPPETFMRYEQSRRDQRVFIPRLQTQALTEQLRQGATLVLDNLEDLHEPIGELALDFQRTFRERVHVNLYASWHTSNAFDLHWDDHDVIVLQVAGRKRWGVYGATRAYPLRQSAALKPPEGPPVWEGHLEDGDLLYLPRGCWHYAVPVAEPTLHLSFGIYNSKGVDLLNWLARQLEASEIFRQDLPRFANPDERAAHLARLRAELLKAWDAGDLMEAYFQHSDGVAAPHPQMSLPWGALSDPLPPSDDVRVRLTTTRPLNLREEGGQVIILASGRRMKFPAAMRGVLEALESRGAVTVGELCAAAEGRVERETARAYVSRLLADGLLALAA
jgi:ribosomal protein L16 Arg81 hydroxylase